MKRQLLRYAAAGPVEAPATAKLLYLLLRDNVGKDGGLTIRKDELAQALGVSPRTVSKNMHCLMEQGYIYIVPTYHGDGGRSANKYILRR